MVLVRSDLEQRCSWQDMVVRRVEFVSRVPAPESGFFQFLRAFVFPMAIKLPFLRARMAEAVAGLDHELPGLMPVRRQSQAEAQ